MSSFLTILNSSVRNPSIMSDVDYSWIDDIRREREVFRKSYCVDQDGTLQLERTAELLELTSGEYFLDYHQPAEIPTRIEKHISEALRKEGFKPGDKIILDVRIHKI